MLLLPISDDNTTYSRPYVNYGLIAINVLIYLLVLGSGSEEEVWLDYGMKPARIGAEPFTLITSMFLHGGFFHLFGNMLFLWIVGDNVEDSLGHGWYLAVYLGGGVVADVIHAAFAAGSTVPTIGASGAVSAVMGFYVLIFPHNRIRILYWLFWYLIGTFWIRAVWAIGAWFALQLVWALVSVGSETVTGVAYWAHVGGFAFGAGLALALRAVWPAVNPHRRHGREPAGPAPRPFGRARTHRGVPSDLGRSWSRGAVPTVSPVSVELFTSPENMERTVHQRLAVGDVAGAEHAFDAFARAYPQRPMDVRVQLGLVQSLERQGRHAGSAQCLEHFLTTHPGDVNGPEAKLALGMIYSRHLGRRDRARLLLGAAAVQHPVPARAALARQELAALG